MVTIHNNKCIRGDSLGAEGAGGLGIPPISWLSWRIANSSAQRPRVRASRAVTNWSVGIVCAVVFLELLSRQLTSNLSSLERPSPTSSYKPDPAAIEATYNVHWCSEGCATSHFSRDGARVTQNPILRSEEHTSELQSRGHLVC